MKNYVTVPEPTQRLASLTCDACGTTYDCEDEFLETQEFLHVEFNAGYGSVFGDTNVVAADVCQHCVKKRLGDALRVVGNYAGYPVGRS